ncbi:leishmanolysin-related zinc metalloendopeptidase [Acaryochloris sp. IP29b_bin.137]|uniref:leishmanolysin-related zinc metalloendopeptidase n=1 Tax=Acaryochloris sp. IP29b_bin.137 TaxID=2969217 RepID=UPI002636180C|nr:leishmanolysin-related zinc metalloendopeptidase [Acaryochloris sp. IP29b_bin.137]
MGLFILKLVSLESLKIDTIESSPQTLEVVGVFLSLSVCLRISWIKNFGSDITDAMEKKHFLVTPRLIEILKVLSGSSLTLKTIDLINNGTINAIDGIVLTTSYSNDVNGLSKFDLKIRSGEVFTFINSEKKSKEENKKTNCLENHLNTISSAIQDYFSPERVDLKVADNLDFLNRSRIIKVGNLNVYKNELTEAFNYGQPITCVYNRVDGEINALQIRPKKIKKPVLEKQLQASLIEQDSTVHIPLPIDLEFIGNFSEGQKLAFRQAAQRWGSIIRGNLPPVIINGKRINGISITARALEMDGPHNRLAQAGPVHLRPGSLLPATGIMEFDSADLTRMEEDGSLLNVIIHEVGHVLGFGTLWEQKGLLQGVGTNNPRFTGVNAMREFAALIGLNKAIPIPIPVENIGGAGTRDGHWRESIFGNEVMTGFLNSGLNPISRLTLASLQDLGYSVNPNAPNPFMLSKIEKLAMMGMSTDKTCHCRGCAMCN